MYLTKLLKQNFHCRRFEITVKQDFRHRTIVWNMYQSSFICFKCWLFFLKNPHSHCSYSSMKPPVSRDAGIPALVAFLPNIVYCSFQSLICFLSTFLLFSFVHFWCQVLFLCLVQTPNTANTMCRLILICTVQLAM